MWLLKAFKSSIGQKVVMAITGLLLCGFLVAHLAGNFLLYVSPEAYNNYAFKLHEQEGLLMIAETGLFGLFFLHLYLAGSTRAQSRKARKLNYLSKNSKVNEDESSLLESQNWMFLSGAIILAFLIVHICDFKLGLRLSETADMEPFDKAVYILRNGFSTVVYVVGPLILAVHLSHGVQSAFQSLGLHHPKYNNFIKKSGTAFSWIIGLGFASFPLWALFFQK